MNRFGQMPMMPPGPAMEPMAADAYQSKTWYVYNTGIPAALAPAGSTQSTFNIDADSDFFLTKIAAFAMDGNAGTTISDEQLASVQLLITNTSSGRAYMNEYVPLPSIAGSARLPFIVPMETFWPAKTTILVQYQNVSDDVTYSYLELSFIGYKAFT